MIRDLRFWWGVALLFLVGLNLRLGVAAIPPVLGEIQSDTGLSSTGSGLLTALPAFCFGAVALATPPLIKRLRMAPLLGMVLALVVLGSAIRLEPSLYALFIGTAVLCSGIAVGNVLVPGLVKGEFSGHTALMVGLYSVALSLGGAISAGLTAPIEQLLGVGWRPAVAVWGAVALVTLALWIPRTGRSEPAAVAEVAPIGRGLWKDRLAWSVTLFMGLQSLAFYATLSWLPSILEDHGVSQTRAGWMLSFVMFSGILAALTTPTLERKARNPALLVVGTALLLGSGYLGLLLAPASMTYLWMTLLGLGQGASLGLALGYIVARAPDRHHVALLSTMAQSVGYLIAATGPFLIGALHSLTSGWTVPLIVLIGNLVPVTITGLASSRDRHVLAGPRPPAPTGAPSRSATRSR